MEARMSGQPLLDRQMLVCAVVVADEMNLPAPESGVPGNAIGR